MNPIEYKNKINNLKKQKINPHSAKVKHELLESLVKYNSVVPMKIIFYIAKANIPLQNKTYNQIKIDTKKLCTYCNINIQTLKRNIKVMQTTSITFISEELGEDGYRKIEEYISLIPYAKFDYNGNLVIDIHNKIAKLIMSVTKPFSIINIENMMKISNKHSIKMIQILERINNFSEHVPKRKHYTLEELNALFGVNYSSLKLFKQNIFDKVKKELDVVSMYSFEARIHKDKLDNKAGRPKGVSIVIDLISNTANLA